MLKNIMAKFLVWLFAKKCPKCNGHLYGISAPDGTDYLECFDCEYIENYKINYDSWLYLK